MPSPPQSLVTTSLLSVSTKLTSVQVRHTGGFIQHLSFYICLFHWIQCLQTSSMCHHMYIPRFVYPAIHDGTLLFFTVSVVKVFSTWSCLDGLAGAWIWIFAQESERSSSLEPSFLGKTELQSCTLWSLLTCDTGMSYLLLGHLPGK